MAVATFTGRPSWPVSASGGTGGNYRDDTWTFIAAAAVLIRTAVPLL
jgi:hypothetical protein